MDYERGGGIGSCWVTSWCIVGLLQKFGLWPRLESCKWVPQKKIEGKQPTELQVPGWPFFWAREIVSYSQFSFFFFSFWKYIKWWDLRFIFLLQLEMRPKSLGCSASASSNWFLRFIFSRGFFLYFFMFILQLGNLLFLAGKRFIFLVPLSIRWMNRSGVLPFSCFVVCCMAWYLANNKHREQRKIKTSRGSCKLSVWCELLSTPANFFFLSSHFR